MFTPSDQSFEHHHYHLPLPMPMGMAAATQTTIAASGGCWGLQSPSSSSYQHKDPQSAPNCPRCASSNTKFCYYNNYSLAQPRYFCKGCRRYWTKGGSLRNVPVGTGCRKSRRRSRSSSSSTTSRAPGQDSSSSSESSNGGGHDSNRVVEIDVAAVFAQYLNPAENPSSPAAVPTSLSSLPSSTSLLSSETTDQDQPTHHPPPTEECNTNNSIIMNPAADEDHLMDQFWDAGITFADDTTTATTTLWSSSSPQPQEDASLFMSTDLTTNWPVAVDDLCGLPHLMSSAVSPENITFLTDDDTNWTNNCFDLIAQENDIIF